MRRSTPLCVVGCSHISLDIFVTPPGSAACAPCQLPLCLDVLLYIISTSRFQQLLRAAVDACRHALELSRQEKYDQAREAFEQLLQQHPTFCKAWVSYAQVRVAPSLKFQLQQQLETPWAASLTPLPQTTSRQVVGSCTERLTESD